MNLKLFKKIIKNLLKIIHIALSLVINALLWIEDKVINLQIRLDTKKPSKPLFYRNSSHEFIKDVGYIHREDT
jgi:hypothetical protein